MAFDIPSLHEVPHAERSVQEFKQNLVAVEKRMERVLYQTWIDALTGKEVSLKEVDQFVRHARQKIFAQIEYWYSLTPQDWDLSFLRRAWSQPSDHERLLHGVINHPDVARPLIQVDGDLLLDNQDLLEIGDEAKRLVDSRLHLRFLEEGKSYEGVEWNTLHRYLYRGGSKSSRVKPEEVPEEQQSLYEQVVELERVRPAFATRLHEPSSRLWDEEILRKKIIFEEAHFRFEI